MIDPQTFYEECLRLFSRIRARIGGVLIPINSDDRVHVFLFAQLDFFTQRCLAASFLLNARLLWDAEIVFRSASESAIKILFVTTTPEPERTKRVEEFRERLNEVENFRYRARASAGKTSKVGTEAIFSMLAMSTEERDLHNAKEPLI